MYTRLEYHYLSKGQFIMRCGTECFIVTIEQDDAHITKELSARSQIDARKIVKKHYGDGVNIKSVRRKQTHG